MAGLGFNAVPSGFRNAGRPPVRSRPGWSAGLNAVPSGFRNAGRRGGGGGPIQRARQRGQLNLTIQPPGVPPPAPVPTSPATPGPGQGQTAGTAPAPYDATYYQQLQNATLAANLKIGGYQRNISDIGTSLLAARQQQSQQQALQTTQLQNAENARGGFAQGILGQNVGQLANTYLTNEAAQARAAQIQQANLNQAIALTQSGLSAEQVALQMAARDRQAQLVATQPGTGSAGPPAPTTSGSGGGSGGGRGRGGGGGGRGGSKGGGKRTPPIRSGPRNPIAQAKARANVFGGGRSPGKNRPNAIRSARSLARRGI
jgi:hypothetical protein